MFTADTNAAHLLTIPAGTARRAEYDRLVATGALTGRRAIMVGGLSGVLTRAELDAAAPKSARKG